MQKILDIKGSKSAKARESNQMNLNTRDIVVVLIVFFLFFVFLFFDYFSKIDIRKVLIFGAFLFTYNTLLVYILWNNVEQKLFDFKRSFIWYQAEGAGPLNKEPRRVQSI